MRKVKKRRLRDDVRIGSWNEFQEMALYRIHPKGKNKEDENDCPAAYDCKRRRIHAARSTLFDQACEVKDGSSGEDAAKVTATWTEQEIASQLVPPPPGLVDDRSAGTTITSTSGDGGFIDSDILKWADSMILTPPSSPISVPSSSQPIEVLVSSDSGTLSDADVSEWIDSLAVAEDDIAAQPSSFAAGSSISHSTSADVSE